MRHSVWLALFLLTPGVAQGQEGRTSLDLQVLRSVYAWEAPILTAPLRLVNATSYPVFALAPLGMYATEGEWAPAVRMVAVEGTAAAVSLGLKRLIRRERPGGHVPGIVLRTDAVDEAVLAHDDFGMPSGHATLAFALATSWAQTRPVWYVVAPAYGWATLIGVSRVWHGAHYPSDVLAGAALGTGVAVLVHALWPSNPEGSDPVSPVPVSLTLRF